MDNYVAQHWYDWMLENFLNGFTEHDLIKKVHQVNPPEKEQVLSAISSTYNSPVLKSYRDMGKKLKRREWLINTLGRLKRLSDDDFSIDRIQVPEFQTFIDGYYSKSIPVVLVGGMDYWPAMKKWSPEYFKNTFGHLDIEVQYDRDRSENYEMYSPNYKKVLPMAEFVDQVESASSTNNFYMTGNNTKANKSVLTELYKDIGDFGHGYRDMSKHSHSNLVWFGPAGVFTPLHFDTFNIILAQVYGRKKVTLIPPWETPKLKNEIGVYSQVNFPDVDLIKHPELSDLETFEVILKPGEGLFIPIGWWHCVKGLDVSMSVSFTNFNTDNNFYKSFPIS